MNILNRLEIIRLKHLVRMDGALDEDGQWVTMNGTHIHFNRYGEVDIGPDRIKKLINGHAYSNKAEYEKEKEKASARIEAYEDRLSEEYEKLYKKIRKKYGDFTAKEYAIQGDESLSNEEKKAKIDALWKESRKGDEEVEELGKKYIEKKKQISKMLREFFDPEYEFNKIDEHSKGRKDDAMTDIINPSGLKYNCQRCVMAYELRERGYDVKASSGEGPELGAHELMLMCFRDPETVSYKVGKDGGKNRISKNVLKKVKDWGDGARAIAMVTYETHGHTYNIVNEGGKVYVKDAQTGLSRDVEKSKSLTDGIRFSGMEEVMVMRVDNVGVTSEIMDYVANVN